MKLSPKYLLAVPALAIALSVLPACGDDSGSNNSPATTAVSGTSAVSPATTAVSPVTSEAVATSGS
ncbi:MAG TPA: hypothetical protein VMK16_19155 [Acidimicrobiales bacterium]|nr:hypothetical protein [Acidimicrobiales bacterium]